MLLKINEFNNLKAIRVIFYLEQLTPIIKYIINESCKRDEYNPKIYFKGINSDFNEEILYFNSNIKNKLEFSIYQIKVSKITTPPSIYSSMTHYVDNILVNYNNEKIMKMNIRENIFQLIKGLYLQFKEFFGSRDIVYMNNLYFCYKNNPIEFLKFINQRKIIIMNFDTIYNEIIKLFHSLINKNTEQYNKINEELNNFDSANVESFRNYDSLIEHQLNILKEIKHE
jgi:hypothetical protein